MLYSFSAINKKMKIGMISYWSCPYARLGTIHAGGMNIYLQYLLDNLGNLGHRVDLFTRDHQFRDKKVTRFGSFSNIIHFSSKSDDLYQDTKYFANQILEYIDKNSIKYDIIHSHYFFSGLVGVELQKKIGCPHATTYHSLAASKDKYAGIKDNKRKKAEKFIAQKASAIIVSTKFEKKEILVENMTIDKNKIFIVRPGVDHKIFKKYGQIFSRRKLHLSLVKKIILFVGRIDPVKGISYLLEAVSVLCSKYSSFSDNFQVILIGGDIGSSQFWKMPEVKKIQKIILEKKLQCCVHFVGSKSYKVLPYYYSAADVVVMPSVYESFGLVVLEAMACGSSVIAAKVGGLKYIIKDKFSGRLFDSGNINQLSAILWDLLQDKKQRKALGEKAISVSRHFNWAKHAKEISSIYKILI